MSQLFEFMSNHVFLVAAFFMVLGMIVFTEYQRVAGGSAALSPLGATRLMNQDDDLLILDVRDDAEYQRGHIINARSFPVGKMDQRLHEIDRYKDRNVIVYCDSGMRANRATARLKKEGFTQLHNITGGMVAWEKASLPVVSA